MNREQRKKIQDIQQALKSANSSISLAKRLFSELPKAKPSPKEVEGEYGTFDGKNMVTEKGKKHKVPENYASKSKIVYGDKLKRLPDGKFKIVERVESKKISGILAKKKGRWHLVGEEGSYKLLSASVKYYKGREGDEAVGIIPKEEKAPFAALEKIEKEEEEKEKPSAKEKKPKKRKKKPLIGEEELR